jgi:hypothetical protein
VGLQEQRQGQLESAGNHCFYFFYIFSLGLSPFIISFHFIVHYFLLGYRYLVGAELTGWVLYSGVAGLVSAGAIFGGVAGI